MGLEDRLDRHLEAYDIADQVGEARARDLRALERVDADALAEVG